MYKKVSIAAGVVIVLGIAYYGISPIFRTVRVDEVAPQAVVTSPSAAQKTKPSTTASSVENTQATAGGTHVVQEKASPVVGTTGHPASGTAQLINTPSGAVVRYENFKTLNGPDLYVYLSNDLEARDFVDLGALKATEGNVNYTVPKGVDVTQYKYVLTWCKAFSVLFNYADISHMR